CTVKGLAVSFAGWSSKVASTLAVPGSTVLVRMLPMTSAGLPGMPPVWGWVADRGGAALGGGGVSTGEPLSVPTAAGMEPFDAPSTVNSQSSQLVRILLVSPPRLSLMTAKDNDHLCVPMVPEATTVLSIGARGP